MLSEALTSLKGVGPALAKRLGKLGLSRVEDLLFLLPLRYEDRTQLVRIGALVAGKRCLTSGEVLLAETAYRGRRNLLVRISDGSGQLTLRFFTSPANNRHNSRLASTYRALVRFGGDRPVSK